MTVKHRSGNEFKFMRIYDSTTPNNSEDRIRNIFPQCISSMKLFETHSIFTCNCEFQNKM